MASVQMLRVVRWGRRRRMGVGALGPMLVVIITHTPSCGGGSGGGGGRGTGGRCGEACKLCLHCTPKEEGPARSDSQHCMMGEELVHISKDLVPCDPERDDVVSVGCGLIRLGGGGIGDVGC